MVDWIALYERDEDRTLEMLERRAARREAREAAQAAQEEKAQQALQDGTGITTTLPAQKPRD